jgi:uncharacterized protein YggL (DUF469 family)
MFTAQELEDAKMGEFQELAWRLRFEVFPSLRAEQKAQLIKNFFDFADANQLGLAGIHEQFIVVSLRNRKAPTRAEQQLLENWLTNTGQVCRIIEISPLEEFSDAHFEFLMADTNAAENDSFTRFFS